MICILCKFIQMLTDCKAVGLCCNKTVKLSIVRYQTFRNSIMYWCSMDTSRWWLSNLCPDYYLSPTLFSLHVHFLPARRNLRLLWRPSFVLSGSNKLVMLRDRETEVSHGRPATLSALQKTRPRCQVATCSRSLTTFLCSSL